MQIQADVRTIMSRTFASRHSLRFPRCTRVRWDKSPMDVQTDQDLWEIVESNKGAIVGEVNRYASHAGPRLSNSNPGLVECSSLATWQLAGVDTGELGSCGSASRRL